jgi:hypothetical protein
VAFPTPNPGRTWPGAGWSVGKMLTIRTWHLPRRILVVLGQVQAGQSGKFVQFERGISHAQSWSYLARCRLVRRENVGNSNVACPTPNPGRTWPGAGWASGKCGQFERGTLDAFVMHLGLDCASRSSSKFLVRPSLLSRCWLGHTEAGLVAAVIPRACRGCDCDPSCTEGCGARWSPQGRSRSTKGRKPNHPEVRCGRDFTV